VLFAGRNIADLNLHQLRDRVLVVENSGVLERSVEENLGLGDPAISRAAMREMLEVVGLEAIVNNLSEGIATKLGAFGYPLSRSETIRLKIAAALLARPQVLVITQIFDTLAHRHRRSILEYIRRQDGLTLLNFSNRRDIAAYDRYVYLEADGHQGFDTITALLDYERQHEGPPPASSERAS
jgi:putative ABC transport system ATP-binding protein